MKKTIILLKVFPVFLILLQGCNNTEHATREQEKKIPLQECDNIEHKTEEQEKKILIFSSDLNDKYCYEKLWYLKVDTRYNSYFNIQIYDGSLILGKIFNEKYDSFINEDIYKWCQCVLFNDSLYVEISDGNFWGSKSIFLKIKNNKYKTVVTMSNDYGPSLVFIPQKSTLKMSLNEFHVGDTIIGEISLSYKDFILFDNVNFLFGYECDGHFMGVVEQGNEEWEKVKLYRPSGERFFQDK